jgi:hypothetical protein
LQEKLNDAKKPRWQYQQPDSIDHPIRYEPEDPGGKVS